MKIILGKEKGREDEKYTYENILGMISVVIYREISF